MSPLCDDCGDDGMTLRENSAVFCSCAIGQRRKRLWCQGQETAKLEARAKADRRDRKHRRLVHDYKAKAAGNGREPGGDDDEVPF